MTVPTALVCLMRDARAELLRSAIASYGQVATTKHGDNVKFYLWLC